jgi:anaerobic magnesium-protoporphyrin IX monomethyl ester cyclase
MGSAMADRTSSSDETPLCAPAPARPRIEMATGAELVLATCPPWDIELPPINLAYLHAYLTQHGFPVSVLDLNLELYDRLCETPAACFWGMESAGAASNAEMNEQMFRLAGPHLDGFAHALVEAGPRALGFSIHYRNFDLTEHLVAKIRRLDKALKIVYGGPQVASSLACQSLHDLSADALVVGDGEEPLLALMNSLRAGAWGAQPIPGVLWRRDGGYTPLERRSTCADLDLLPFPSFEPFARSRYLTPYVLPFVLSRGCVCNCVFCEDRGLAGRFRMRSPHSAVAEIEERLERYHVNSLRFNDLLCNGDLKKLEAFCDLVIEHQLPIYWHSYAVIRKGMTPRLFAKLKRSGCIGLIFGLESGSDHVLALMNKHYDSALAGEVLRMCKESGIGTSINIIVGFPGEKEEHHRQTLRFIEENAAHIDSFTNLGTLSVSPGSRVHLNQAAFGIAFGKEGSWTGDDGNDEELRKRRLVEVFRLARDLGKTPAILNNIDPRDPRVAREPDPRASSGAPRALTLTDLRLEPSSPLRSDARRPGGCFAFKTGQRIVIGLYYRATRQVARPLFRVQIFRNEPTPDPPLVFGSNNHRFATGPEVVHPGDDRIYLVLYSQRLGPGTYCLTAGIWPDELSEEPFDVRHGSLLFYVEGEGKNQGPLVHLPHAFRLAPLHPPDAEVRLAGTGLAISWSGDARVSLGPEDELSLDIVCQNDEREELLLEARILRDAHLVHRTRLEEPLAPGRHRAHLRYPEIGLLQGDYRLSCLLLAASDGREVAREDHPFTVVSQRFEGAGLLFCPAVWTRSL